MSDCRSQVAVLYSTVLYPYCTIFVTVLTDRKLLKKTYLTETCIFLSEFLQLREATDKIKMAMFLIIHISNDILSCIISADLTAIIIRYELRVLIFMSYLLILPTAN